jgi:ubiquinone/menaquinone biosynthesis C-methylase UbiE
LPAIVGTPSFYDFITGEGQYYLEDRWDFRECAQIIQRLKPNAILDIGCGLGAFLDIARAISPASQTYGQDLNEAQVTNDLRSKNHKYLGSDVGALPASSVDLVTALQVLEHVSDPMGFLNSLIRALQPGGRLLISVPDRRSLVSEFDSTLTEVPPHHVTRWEEKSLRAAFHSLGLSVEYISRQPLERYQWDTYLQPAVEREAWFSTFLKPFIHAESSLGDHVLQIRKLMEARGVEILHGINSHTILIVGIFRGK